MNVLFVFCILYAYLENIHTIQQVMAFHNTNWPEWNLWLTNHDIIFETLSQISDDNIFPQQPRL